MFDHSRFCSYKKSRADFAAVNFNRSCRCSAEIVKLFDRSKPAENKKNPAESPENIC
jgi:hypothetical protein